MPARLAKIVMAFGLALLAALITFTNVTDYDSNYQFVRHVLSMDTTFPDNAAMYRAITAPWAWTAGYWAIIAGEGLTAALFLVAGLRLLRAREQPAAVFNAAKGPFHLAAAVAFLVWFVGFMAIGGEWFLMWQSATWNGQEAAFRFYVTVLAVLIYVNQPDGELR
jgi:predicted small integral membrane protein